MHAKVIPITFDYITMGNAMLFLYFAGSGMNRVRVVLSGFSDRLLSVIQGKKRYVGMVVCIFFATLMLVYGDRMVMIYA